MLNFFKQNGYIMVKIVLYQIAMSMFGGMLVLAGAQIRSDALIAILSIFSIVFYLYLLYVTFYEIGQKDGIRIKAGRLKFDGVKYFLIALCAGSVNFIFGILTVIFKSLINNVSLFQDVSSLGEVASPAWAANAYELFNTLTRAIQAMYVGVLRAFFPGNVLMLLVIPIPAVIVVGVSYRLGVKYCDGFIKSKKEKNGERYAEK